jgi:hypothetical protein
MNKWLLAIVLVSMSVATLNANNVFKAKQANMKAKMADKQSQAKSKEALKFFKQKSECIDSAKNEEDLKSCRTKFPPQVGDDLVAKQ